MSYSEANTGPAFSLSNGASVMVGTVGPLNVARREPLLFQYAAYGRPA